MNATEDKLEQLLAMCRCGVFITVNEHRNYYITVREHLTSFTHEDFIKDIDPIILEKMIEMDTVVEIQCYPDTPIGSYRVYHYDMKEALTESLNLGGTS